MAFEFAVLDLFLLACPLEFRRAYRTQIRADVRDMFAREYSRHGYFGAYAAFTKVVFDVLATGVIERATMIARDLVYAIRSLRRTPLFTAIVIATLAVAIGANAAVFSVLKDVLLKPLPYADPQALVSVSMVDGTVFSQTGPFSYPNFTDVRAQNRSFSDMAVADRMSATMTGHGRPHALTGQRVSFSFFDVFGVNPEVGRFFTSADARPGSAPALVISNSIYGSVFGRDSRIIGKLIALDGDSYRIVGVAPPQFKQPRAAGFVAADFWSVIIPNHPQGDDSRGQSSLSAYARLRLGVSVAAATADLTTIMAHLAQRYPADDRHKHLFITGLTETVLGPVRPLLFSVFAAVAGVLLVACANVANLLLSRAATRERELAVRYAIGASRSRIVAQILTETLLFAVIGGAIGIVLAAGAVRAFVALDPPGIPGIEAISFDRNAALYTFAVVLFCTLAAGLVPALGLSRIELGGALKSAGRGGDRSRGARTRAAFVVAEISITLALVVACGLVVRSFIVLTNAPLGFDPTNVYVVNVGSLSQRRYATNAQIVGVNERLVTSEGAVPGVIDAAWSTFTPFTGQMFETTFTIPERPVSPGDDRTTQFNIVSSSYFSVMRIPLLRGRLFNDGDKIGAPRVIIVNEAFVHAYYANASPIGARIRPGVSETDGPLPERTIVGIAADTRIRYAQAAKPEIYYPVSQTGFNFGSLLVRVRSTAVAPALAAAVPAVDHDFDLPLVRPFSDNLSQDAARTRIAAIALGALASIALLLAIAGIYAVVSYGVSQRTHEFGVRIALGARPGHILGSVLLRAGRLAALGIAFGLILAAFGARLVAAQLYGVGLVDPLTYGLVVLVLIVAALSAAAVPALRDARRPHRRTATRIAWTSYARVGNLPAAASSFQSSSS